MKLLLIEPFLLKEYDVFQLQVGIILIVWGLVLVAIAVDFVSGYRKAKQRGEARTSSGLRRTVDKAVRYYSLMIIALLFDCIVMFFLNYPIVTFIFAGFLFAVELKSIWEKADKKTKKTELDTILEIAELVKNKEDLVSKIIEIIKEKSQKQPEDA
jgi:hypothetical protein